METIEKICPKCNQIVPKAEACRICGIVFSKYERIQEKISSGMTPAQIQGEIIQKAKQKERADILRRVAKAFVSNRTLPELLRRYEKQIVGFNCSDPLQPETGFLLSVGEDHFSIYSEKSDAVCSYPFSSVVSVVELNRSARSAADTPSWCPVVIQVDHPVVYKGARSPGILSPSQASE